MTLSPEGIALYTLLFKIFLTTTIGTALLCIFLNYNTKLTDKDRKIEQKKIASKILNNYSINNAKIINRETINRNNYVRPTEKTFFEDIIKTEPTQTDAIECNIINCYPIISKEEDSSIENKTTPSIDLIQTYPKSENKTLKRQLLKK